MASVSEYFLYSLIAIFVLLVLGYLVTSFINDINTRSNSESLIVDGTQLGRAPKTIPGSKIPASRNGRYGTEFTYLTWLFINDLVNTSTYQPIFIKGSPNTNPEHGDDYQLPYISAPGILIGPNGNKITIIMNTLRKDEEPIEKITIDNIPMNKWFQLGVVLINNKIDVYINDNLKQRLVLKGIPKLNVGDLHVASNNGFDGFISNAKYFAYAAPYYKIDQHFRNGPSQKPCDITGSKPPYLANNYWISSN